MRTLLGTFLLVATVVLCSVAGAAAQACREITLSTEVFNSWSNPHPDQNDYALPGPGGLPFVFTRVGLGASDLYGDEKTTYKMGASKTVVFETPLAVRVGSPISDRQVGSALYVGKYELTKAQYAYILGGGQLRRGLEAVAARTKEQRVLDLIAGYTDPKGACQGRLTKPIAELLAEPITYLSYSNYVEALDTFNLYCIGNRACGERLLSLSRNPDYPAFVRLPTEHEWEFVARGGREFVEGKISRDQLQGDLPPMAVGKTLQDYAHLGNDPQRLLPIGSKQPLFGFYDLIGNAGELMLNPFTAENGFGAVGAYVVRGGSYRLPRDQFRVSMRDEQPAFRRDDSTKELLVQNFPYVGVRLALGLPVAGSIERTGSSELQEEFASRYRTLDETGDQAGNSFADAKDLGVVAQREIKIVERLSKADTSDFFSFAIGEYAALQIATQNSFPMSVEILDESMKSFYRVDNANRSSSGKSQYLLPGKYFVRIDTASQSQAEERYEVTLTKVPAPDTGIPRPETAALAAAKPVASGFSIDGFVGAGDRADTYPLVMDSAQGGLKIELDGLSTTTAIALLDERQMPLARVVSDNGESSTVLETPATAGSKIFIQVTAEGSGSTKYAMKVSSVKLIHDAYATSISGANRPTGARVEYPGVVSVRNNRLFLPINMTDAAKLRVEMTGLREGADMEIVDSAGSAIASDHRRPSIQDEVFSKDLEAGQYYARVTLDAGASATSFNLSYRLEAPSATVPMHPSVARRKAEDLFGTTPGTLKLGETKFYKFKVSDVRAVVVADLFGFSPSGDLDLMLEDSLGQVLAKSTKTGGEGETIKHTVSVGEYYLRIVTSGNEPQSYFSVGVEVLSSMREPRYSGFGTLVESNGDWSIYRQGDSCNMITAATSVEPDIGWREERPIFYIGVDKGGDGIYIALDTAQEDGGTDLFRSGSIAAAVDGKRKIPVEFEKRWMKPLTRKNCKAGTCIDSDAIRGFRGGSLLTISGADPSDGGRREIQYSLSGYTKSARRINEICKGRANWIWK